MPTVVVYHDIPDVASSLEGERTDLAVVTADNTEEAVRALQDAEILVISNANWEDRLLDGLSEGDWIQSTSAGFDAFPLDALEERGIRHTNAAGLHGPMVAEHAFAMALAHSRGLHRLRDRQHEADWDHSLGKELGDWLGKTMTVVGLGRIGDAIATRGQAFTMDVYGIKRHPNEYEGSVPSERVRPPGDLESILPETDLLALSVPLTEETHHLVDSDVLEALPESAFIVNISRGPVIDEASLIDALEAGEIAGAGLDVFEEEPLPADSPLWDRDDVIVTPHVGGLSDGFDRRVATLFFENYDRRQAGEPLKNVTV